MIRINRTIPELIINIKSSGISISVCKVNDIAYLRHFPAFPGSSYCLWIRGCTKRLDAGGNIGFSKNKKALRHSHVPCTARTAGP